MANSSNQELSNLISCLSEANFRDLVKEFLKEKYKTEDVIITDGPYDGGNDAQITIGDKLIKRNLQITVQKSNIDTKIASDVLKSSENVTNHRYLNNLDFFSSINISKSKQDEFIGSAEINHQINLIIYDANRIAELADEYPAITNFLYKIYVPKDLTKHKIDKNKKVVYDLLAKGYKTGSIKKQLVQSYILSFIYTNPKTSIEKIHNDLKDILSPKYDLQFYQNQLGQLKSSGDVEVLVANEYTLSDKAFGILDNINKQSAALEEILCNEIKTFLDKEEITDASESIIQLLQDLYKENYKIDVDEINSKSDSYSSSVKNVFKGLVKFFTDAGKTPKDAPRIARELLDVCSGSEFLGKIGVTALFTNLFKSEKLERYISNQTHNLVIDTQILIRILCIYDERGEFNDNAFKAVQDFLKTCNKYKKNVTLTTTSEYVEEVVGHIQEALKLNRFLALPIFDKIGHSKNILFNYYSILKSNDLTDCDNFSDFMDYLLGQELPDYEDVNFQNKVFNIVKDIFEYLGITVVSHPFYPLYNDIMKDYEIELSFMEKFRSYNARRHDIMTLLYLSSQDLHIDKITGEFNEPYLITWDTVFYSMRTKFLEKYPSLCNWFIYSPSKFSDKLSIINFDINSKAINYNVIALTEHNFNHSNKSICFFDLISSLFNKKDLSQLNLAGKLVDLKEKTIEVDEEKSAVVVEEKSPLIDILWHLREKYINPSSKYSIKQFTSFLESNDNEEEIIKLLEESITLYKNTKKISDAFYDKFDDLIKVFIAK